jgi:hypothetical protein
MDSLDAPAAWLLTWNPAKIDAESAGLLDCGRVLALGGDAVTDWSTGFARRIAPGDQLYLLRQGVEPRGIIGRATAVGPVYEDGHWQEGRTRPALYVPLVFDALRIEDPPFWTRDELWETFGRDVNWHTQASGIRIPPDTANVLDTRFR